MKVAIWGTGKYAEKLYQIITGKIGYGLDVEIVYFLETQRSKDMFHGIPVLEGKCVRFDEFERLLIAAYQEDEIRQYIRKVVDDYDSVSPKIISARQVYKVYLSLAPVQSCMADGAVYLNYNTDLTISEYMFLTGETFAKKEIEAFMELAGKYYPDVQNGGAGYFLDIGANIGTTSICVKKKIPQLKVIGFECGKKNYDMFRINLILNHVEDVKAEYLGLSNRRADAVQYLYICDNAGGGRIASVADNQDVYELSHEIEETSLDTLNHYVKENEISVDDISYIWIDTEGHEVEILLGAQEILRQKKIPIFQEFNPTEYRKKNLMDVYVKCMEGYRGFIDAREYISEKCIKEHLISELAKYDSYLADKGFYQTDLFFF